MLPLIQHNPFRILGVYTNASKRDIVANINKMNAFLKIGKEINFPVDFTEMLGPLRRDNESVAQADSLLTIDDDKVKYALFWFINATPLDDMAFKRLKEGKKGEAVELWAKQDNLSSLQNRAVCALMDDNVEAASIFLSKLYAHYAEQFLVTLDVHDNLDPDNLIQRFVASLIECRPATGLAQLTGEDCEGEWNTTAKRQLIAPVIQQLQDAINICAQTKDDDPEKRFKAGRRLYDTALPLVEALTRLLREDDVELVTISDKVGNEIMNCSIDYFNKMPDSVAVTKSAFELLQMAQPFIIGPAVLNRYNLNEQKLSEMMHDLPPVEVERETIELNDLLHAYIEERDDLPAVGSYIDHAKLILERIADKVGKNNFYVAKSSMVVRIALNRIIEIVNDVVSQEWSDYRQSLVNQAYNLMCKLKLLVMDYETRDYFDRNFSKLNDMRNPRQVYSSGGNHNFTDSCWWNLLKFLGYAALLVLFFFIKGQCSSKRKRYRYRTYQPCQYEKTPSFQANIIDTNNTYVM